MPFADSYFDAIISVDAWYYFALGEDYIDTHIAPLLKKDGILAVSIEGLQKEFGGNVPEVPKTGGISAPLV